jgi:carbohydrate-binding DOMON domain-containing protein
MILNRDKAQKLIKAEATIEKYQKKMEAMTALKNEVSVATVCRVVALTNRPTEQTARGDDRQIPRADP